MSENSNNNSQPERFNEGQQGAHLANDSSKISHQWQQLQGIILTMILEDERSIANRLAAETVSVKHL